MLGSRSGLLYGLSLMLIAMTACSNLKSTLDRTDATLQQSFASFDRDFRNSIGLPPYEESQSKPAEPSTVTPLPTSAGKVSNLEKKYRDVLNLLATDPPVDVRTRAIGNLRAIAEAGYVPAQYQMGELHWASAKEPADQTTALAWFEKAAHKGSGPAAYRLGEATLNGLGTPADPARAAAWYRRAAENNVADAQYMLGMLYLSGTGVRKETTEAERWLARAAANGHPKANTYLAALREQKPLALHRQNG